VINVPPRKIGLTTWKVLRESATEGGELVWDVVQRAVGGGGGEGGGGGGGGGGGRKGGEGG